METTNIVIDRVKARELYQQYKKHAHYSEPIDAELQRAYQLLAQGRLVIRALESIKAAGLDDRNMPKLAIARATHSKTICTLHSDGSGYFAKKHWRCAASDRFSFAVGSFKVRNDIKRPYESVATVPYIPAHLRPKRGLHNYHILFEAEWGPVVPVDPYLLRRIGKADLWLVVAQWDLTEVERAALSTRIIVN